MTIFTRKHFLFSLLLSLFTSSVSNAESLDLRTITAPTNYHLGLAFPGGSVHNYPIIKEAGIGIVRISASWGRIQPTEGTFDWQGFDSKIQTLQHLGLKPFITFESNANWATRADTHHIRNGEPLDINQWKSFVEAVVERYNFDGYEDAPNLNAPIQYYQAANEWISDQNRSGGWAGSTEALIDYINTAHDAVKKIDPNATFVLGGLATFNLDALLLAEGIEDFLVQQKWGHFSSTTLSAEDVQSTHIQNIINNHFRAVLFHSQYDLADAHLYGPIERDPARLNQLSTETTLPIDTIISSECGGPSLDYEDTYTDENHFHAVINRNLNLLALESPFCLWFGLGEAMSTTWGNQKVPLFDKSGQAKPGYYAYKLLAYLFDGQENITVEALESTFPWVFRIQFPESQNHTDLFIGPASSQADLISLSNNQKFDAFCVDPLTSKGDITRQTTTAIECNNGIIVLGAKLPNN
ncbi:beta-galactosidase [Neptuniibacter sp. PT34_22]|uniref:beta-galactosidase n=1 Tax=Neptuniibacter sp. PT34_22 TaxID=3398205 RepID=UPI0039F60A44